VRTRPNWPFPIDGSNQKSGKLNSPVEVGRLVVEIP